MSKAVTKETESTLTATPEELNMDILKDICRTQNLTNEEFKMFAFVCKERRLNPALSQIYAIKRAGKMTIQIGIDGYRALADRTGCYMPGKAPEYKYDDKGRLVSATAFVKKWKKGAWHEISAEAFYSEYVSEYNGKPSGQWGKMPHTMLAKCAESAALRRAFAGELSGLYTNDEMGQADTPKDEGVITVNADEFKADQANLELNVLLVEEGLDTTLIDDYIEEMAEKKGWSQDEVLKSCMANKDVFIPHYAKWSSNKATEVSE